MRKKRIVYPDLLRIAAAFFVVLIHVTAVGINDDSAAAQTGRVCVILNSVSHWAVPVFFMISGMLFLDPERKLTLEKLFRKNIVRILLCLVVWGFFYSLLDQYLYGGLSLRSPILAVYGILSGNTGYHLWFLYSLLALYIATPTLRIFTANASRRQMEYALLVWFALGIFAGDVNRIAGALLGLDELLCAETMVIVDHAGFFLLGHYLVRYPLTDKWARYLYVTAAICLCAMPVCNALSSMWGTRTPFSDRLGIGNCFAAMGVFVFASRLRTDSLSERFCRMIRWLSDRTFGIYLIHVFYVAVIFQMMKMDLFSASPVCGVLSSTVIIFLLSALTAELLSRLPLTQKLV